jgi:N,N'-diacetyllegionaminate synthase
VNDRVLIIAEAGVNHNGDMEIAKKLIHAAAEAGADLVKFQTFRAKRLVTPTAVQASYQKRNSVIDESQYEMLQKLELTLDMHQELIDECGRHGIGFFSTGFDIESVDLLVSLGQKLFKIPSGEITNLPYLRYIGGLRLPIILSTGMSTLGDIEAAINVLEEAGTDRKDLIVLHCTTEYPAPMVEVNLKAISTLRSTFGLKTGYSDHTMGIEVPIAAVALGAVVIEKHFTLDRSLPGPDHIASLEADELKSMVVAIRNIELAVGDGIKKLTRSEFENLSVIRKSIVTKIAIKKGETFKNSNIVAKRPGSGLSPMLWDSVIGKQATRDFSIDELVEL